MPFATTLNEYCERAGCTNKELAALCGISPSTLSRYRNGGRTPEAGGPVIDRLAGGLAEISKARNQAEPLDEAEVSATLNASITESNMVGMDFNTRLDALMRLIGIHNVEMADATGVDPSYISRIRTGKRTPSKLVAFDEKAARLAADLCLDRNMTEEVVKLVGAAHIMDNYPNSGIDAASSLGEAIGSWLLGNIIVKGDVAELESLITWLDTTDFSPWITLESTPPKSPSDTHMPPTGSARFYYGLGGMRNAEIEFLTTAAESGSRELSMSSDIPLLQMELDRSFIKKYKRGMENVLRAGCHVNVVHGVERPLSDIIESMRLWAPFYMTGRVTPYYLAGIHNRLFWHVNYVCDTCALASEAMIGHQEDGRYFFSTRPSDVAYYQKKMGFILERATSLMEVYRECDPDQQAAFETAEAARQEKGNGRQIGKERFKNVRVMSYAGDCVVTSVPSSAGAVHFVMRHPKISYAISHIE